MANGLTVKLENSALGVVEFADDGNDGVVVLFNNSRAMSILPAGGHWEIQIHKVSAEETFIEVDENDYPVIHEN